MHHTGQILHVGGKLRLLDCDAGDAIAHNPLDASAATVPLMALDPSVEDITLSSGVSGESRAIVHAHANLCIIRQPTKKANTYECRQHCIP